MKYFITLTTLLAAAAATALPVEERATVCPSGETEYCCELSVDGVATLSCQTPSKTLTSVSSFTKYCNAKGLTAECCVLGVDGIGLVCNSPGS